MILLVSSAKDLASSNIKKQVLEHYPFERTSQIFDQTPVYSAEINGREVKLITLQEETIKAQNLPERFSDLSLIVFISRHSSQSGTPTLSVHTPGNLGPAELGGLPRNVSISPATAMRDALKALLRYQVDMCLEYEVSYECTHHGPSLNVPTAGRHGPPSVFPSIRRAAVQHMPSWEHPGQAGVSRPPNR